MLAWYANPDGHIAWFNQRWYDYTGMLFHEQVGWRWQSVVAPDDLPRLRTRWPAALAGGEPWEEIFRLRRNDGELRWFLSRALPLRDVTGRIVRWFGVTVDIDDQKRAETQARASCRAKDEFLAMLGHELRNPLAPILSAVNLMTMSDPTMFPRERAIIERQVQHLVHLVDDLLDVSRITGGKLELQREPIELAEVVARAVEMVSPLFEKKTHRLSVDVPPRGLLIDGDVARLAQVIANLLTNAAKYTPAHGSIVVTGEPRGSHVSLRVRDTGIGISAEMLPHVFELFAQDRQARDRAEGGLGLGLAIVHNLVAMHGGTATASRDGVGRGSELAIELPVSMRPHDRSALPGAVREVADPAEARKVLVVDDNEEAAELIAVSLTALGHEVRVAFDAASALTLVDEFVPEVALLDIGLPEMDGYELARRLRALVSPHAIRFVAITGYGNAADHLRSQAAGFALHLVKPVDVVQVQDSIRYTDAA
jgi:PAS domain S-box-containing protein